MKRTLRQNRAIASGDWNSASRYWGYVDMCQRKERVFHEPSVENVVQNQGAPISNNHNSEYEQSLTAFISNNHGIDYNDKRTPIIVDSIDSYLAQGMNPDWIDIIYEEKWTNLIASRIAIIKN